MPGGKNIDELGPYTRPRSLTKVHFMSFYPNEIKIDDISYHLARACRFGNAIEPHYSVAEHSIMMANMFIERDDDLILARQALMHDAAEYLFTDLPAPIKKFCPDYEKLMDTFEAKLMAHFGVQFPYDPKIKNLDKIMCSTEQLVLRGHQPDTYDDVEPDQNMFFHLWSWQKAQSEFQIMFQYLFPDYKDAI